MLQDSKTNFNTYLKNRPKAKFTFRQVNIGDITKLISKLTPKPNAGPEYISSKLLKVEHEQARVSYYFSISRTIWTGNNFV